jgi:hypothetical protein
VQSAFISYAHEDQEVLPIKYRQAVMPPMLGDAFYCDADKYDPETLSRQLTAAMTAHLEGRDADAAQEAATGESYRGSCTQMLAARLADEITGILTEIRRLRAGKPTAIRVTNFHNDNIGDPTVSRAADGPSKVVVDTYSKAICDAAARSMVPCADVYHAFNGRDGTRFDGPYVAADHVHPNQRGHALIAALLANLRYAPLRRA